MFLIARFKTAWDCGMRIADCGLDDLELRTPGALLARRQQGGLTFVELLMAATMFSILMVGVLAHLRGGIVAWHRSRQAIEQLQRVRVALEQLERDLANAFDFDLSRSLEPAPAFARNRLAFFSTRSAAAASGDRAWFIEYAVEDRRLMRRQQLLREARAAAQGLAVASAAWSTQLEPVEELGVACAYRPRQQPRALVWASCAEYEDRLPRLLRVTIAPPAGVASSGSISRLFVVPVGVLKDEPT